MKLKFITCFLLLVSSCEAQLHRNLPKIAEKYFYNLPYNKFYDDWIEEWRTDEHVQLDSMANRDSGYYYFGRIIDYQPFAYNVEEIRFRIGPNTWNIITGTIDTLHEGTYSLQMIFNFSGGDSLKKSIKQLFKKVSNDFLRCTDIEREVTSKNLNQGKIFETIFFFNRQERVPILKIARGEWEANQQPFFMIQLDFSVN